MSARHAMGDSDRATSGGQALESGHHSLLQCYHLRMRDTLEVLLRLREEGALADFAIGGTIPASFFTPAVATEDLDIFAFLKPSASGLPVLTPLYKRLQELGGRIENE